MHGSEGKDGLHSTPEEDPRPKLMRRMFFSLAIVGVMVGLMIGRLTAPQPTESAATAQQARSAPRRRKPVNPIIIPYILVSFLGALL